MVRDKEFNKNLRGLMIPIAFQNFMLAAVSAGDSAMLGFVDENAMAAVSLAGNIQFVENLFLSAIVCGGTIMTAQYWGKKDKTSVERLFGLILRYATVVSAVFFIVSAAFPEFLMTLFTDEPELITLGAEYVRIASLSYLITGVSQCWLCVMKTTGQTKQSAAISTVALILDTVLNAVFIFGFNMGVKGAALTTTLARVAELVIVLVYTRKMAVKPDFKKVSRILNKDFVKCSVPILINAMAWGLGTTLYSVIIGHLGVVITAANSVANIVRQLAISVCRGLGSGADVADAVQALIDANPNRTIYFPDGEYLLSKPICTPAEPTKSVSLELSDFAVLKATGDWQQGEAVVQLGGKDPANDTATNGSNYSLEGGIIDGSGMANGISINSGRETAIRNVSIKNTVVGIHIKHGANNGSSDADIYGVNIIGTGKTDSVGMLLEGYDNTVTNVRIGNVFTGVHIKSAGNMLRNVHPLYYSDYTDYQNSCGFLDECGNNWYDYCYSDQFGVGFRTTGNGSSYYNDCYCFWYSESGETHTAFKADGKLNSTLTNFKTGFTDNCENIVLTVAEKGGDGSIDNIEVQGGTDSKVYLAYVEDASLFERIAGFFALLFS
ncbi:MAG: hypothetical protein IJZ35_08020 [Clostridia bacterium]|nr:hypothetical protein [Clostridia bacterium]